MKIAIIGGSIAGCALALLLKDKFDVTVFERSKNLISRGAGITMAKELLQNLISKGILDKDTPNHSATSRSFYCQLPSKPDYGHCLWRQDISVISLHWDTLFSNLRQRLPDTIYQAGCHITQVQLNDESPHKITLENGKQQEFDLIVFADGYQSIGRQLISQDSEPNYSGYIAWRGTIDFDLLKDKAPFINNIPYYCFERGHLLAYPIYHNKVKKLNWVFYERLSVEEITSLGPASQIEFSDTAKNHLHQLANNKLPKAAAQMICETPLPFMQKIVDVKVDKLIAKGALLLGDASVVLKPHVGSGASLAIQDALKLSDELHQGQELQQSLEQWENAILPARLATYALSQRMANALVLNPVLWQGMDEEKMTVWWDGILNKEKWYTNAPFLKSKL
ncbi:MAG: FAD-dependent monooxygenase [Legionella sp.]|nr:FAD-dependent monooxygenase [Legionella sp.]